MALALVLRRVRHVRDSDADFVTLFHTKKGEPLEKVAKAFFGRRWGDLKAQSFKSLAVSRFLAASVVGQVAEQAFREVALTHYPKARLVGGESPMFESGSELWIGYRFFRRMRMLGRVAQTEARAELSRSTLRTRNISSTQNCRLASKCIRSLSSTQLGLADATRSLSAYSYAGLSYQRTSFKWMS